MHPVERMRQGIPYFVVVLFVISLFGVLGSGSALAQYCGWCGDGFCDSACGETTGTCVPDCGAPTYTISGRVFIDTDGDGNIDFGESGYNSGASQIVNLNTGPTDNTNSTGNYSFFNLAAGSYQLVLTVPSGYRTTVPASGIRNPSVGPSDSLNNNFGIQDIPNPTCPGGLSTSVDTINPGGDVDVDVSGCTLMTPTPTVTPIFDWDPPTGTNPQCNDGINNDGVQGTDSSDPDCHVGGIPTNPYDPYDDSESTPSNSCQDSSVHTVTNTTNSSSGTWTAPACPSSPLTCTISIDVNGAGGTTTYTGDVDVSAAYSITTNIRSVTSVGACASDSGIAYASSISVNATGGSLPPGGTTQVTSSGTTSFACLPSGDYLVTLSVPSGYSIIGRSGGTNSGLNAISFSSISSNETANFCIAPIDPWFQTDFGDVRFRNISNPVPSGKYGSTNATYPGIYYSSGSTANFGQGSASVKNWVSNNEYSYNADTENRNGGMSYDFYKSKARRDGVEVTSLDSDTFTQSDLTKSQSYVNDNAGVFEREGDLNIGSYTHTNGKRVVILVSGNVTITDDTISIPLNQGILIIAAKGDITFSSSIGDPTLSNSYTIDATNTFDGIYTAQDDIILESRGNTCSDGITSDLRLNIGGALIAYSLKPFSSSGTGVIQNNRSLCVSNLLYPSLFVSSRPDFLIQMSDFYKTTYTKWKEDNP